MWRCREIRTLSDRASKESAFFPHPQHITDLPCSIREEHVVRVPRRRKLSLIAMRLLFNLSDGKQSMKTAPIKFKDGYDVTAKTYDR